MRSTTRYLVSIPSILAILAIAALPACSSAGSDAEPPPAPTYHEAVAPILAEHCASCHSPGQIAPFSLLTYEDAKRFAGAIKTATANRTMPPFNVDNSGDCQSYTDARWLSDAEIATLGAWADAGAPEGDPAHEAPPPATPRHLDAPSHHIDMGTEYTPHGDGSDDYRCFVVDPGTTADAFLTAYEVQPGDARVVHHVILFGMKNADAEAKAAELDAADEGPGYTCFGGPSLGAGGFNYLAAWAPGTGATFYPAGTGIKLGAGRKAIMQVHYNVSAGTFPDRTKIALQLSPSVAKTARVMPIVELALALPPREADVTVSNDQPLTQDTTYHVLGVYPHMHLLGKSLQIDRVRGDETSCVTRVPRWNFHWQQFFFYEQPIDLVKGDIARITCSYDTRSMTDVVTWGEGTADEMCVAGLYVTSD